MMIQLLQMMKFHMLSIQMNLEMMTLVKIQMAMMSRTPILMWNHMMVLRILMILLTMIWTLLKVKSLISNLIPILKLKWYQRKMI